MAENNTKTTRVPKLRVSNAVKRANKFEHTKRVMNTYISSGYFAVDNTSTTFTGANYRNLSLLYDAYNNQLPDAYFDYVRNPLNSQKEEYTRWPATIRNFSIIRPNIDLLEGEYEKRPFVWTVKVHNADAVNGFQDQQYQEILRTLQQQFINALNSKNYDTGQPTQDTEPPQKIKAKFQSNYRDQRAMMGESALNIIIDEQHLIEKFKRLFRDWLIAGEVYSYKGIRGGKMVYERVSPMFIDWDKSPDTEYIEDGQWVVRRLNLTAADINDLFYEELSEEDLDIIEDQQGHIATRGLAGYTYNNYTSPADYFSNTTIPVFHVCWKYFTKIGILTFVDEFGQYQEIEVPEEYKPDKDAGEHVEWYWVNEVWEGYRIGADIYLGIKPIPNQRNTVNNLSECKLPYNGKRFSDTHSRNTSPVEIGLPYETLYRILHFHLEKTIAKSKGKVVLMDQNAIPKKQGWDEEKFFYFSDALGWGLVDRNQPGADKSFNQYTVLDLGLYQHLNNLIQLMEFVKSEWDEVLGITRQRKGDVNSSDTVRGTQAAISQSAVISEKVYSRFEEFVESELRGLLDVSKLAWVDGYSALYQGDDMRTSILSIDPGEYIESDFGVYISRSARDIQNLEMVRQQVQAFAQNGTPPSTLIDIVQAQSLSKLKSILQEAEQRSMESQQATMGAEQQHEEKLSMIKEAYMELQGYIDERLLHAKYDREEDLEMLKQTGVDQNPDPIIDPSNAQKVMLDDQNKKREIALKERSEAVKAGQKNRELDLKEKELVVRKQIADKQASVALKNKVAGEKSKSK